MTKIPTALTSEKFKSGVELGLWFATLFISFNVAMGAFSFATEKVNNWRMRKQIQQWEQAQKAAVVPLTPKKTKVSTKKVK